MNYANKIYLAPTFFCQAQLISWYMGLDLKLPNVFLNKTGTYFKRQQFTRKKESMFQNIKESVL